MYGQQIQRVRVIILIATCVGTFGCLDEACSDEDAGIGYLGEDFYQTLQEPEWPTYSGPCFLFQVPEQLNVYWHHLGLEPFDLQIKIYEEEEEDLLLVLTPRKNLPRYRGSRERERQGVRMGVGGMDAWFYQTYKKDGSYNGDFLVELPEVRPDFVTGHFQNLTAEQRNLVFRIFTSIRFEPFRRDVDGVPVQDNSKIALQPVRFSVNFAERPEFCSW